LSLYVSIKTISVRNKNVEKYLVTTYVVTTYFSTFLLRTDMVLMLTYKLKRNYYVLVTYSEHVICKSLWHCSLNGSNCGVTTTCIYSILNTLPGRNNYVWVFTLASRPYPYVTKTLKSTLSQRLANSVFWIRYQYVQITFDPFLREDYVATTYFRYVICKSLWQRIFQRFCYVRIWSWC
jgi:hypothetical protein